MTRRSALSLLFASAAGAARRAPFRAGAARLRISPDQPVWLAGYAARTHPSTDVAVDLWAKALALQDAHGGRVVIVTMDLLRVPRIDISQEVKRRYGLERSQLLLNCAHNHSGPTLWEPDAIPTMPADDFEKCRAYTEHLAAGLVDLVGAALRDLAPASISHVTGEAEFGANRRVLTKHGYDIGHNPDGPTDRRVPVLQVAGPGGQLRAVLFGYGCHNTTVGPGTYRVNGDYAGFAQQEIERAHPGATALFLQLCAGDQDPYPRGGLDMAERHGKELAAAVDHAMAGKPESLAGPIRTAFQTVDLVMEPHTREDFEHRLGDSNPAVVRNARAMLKDYDDGHPMRALSYPVQAVRIGPRLALVAIGGEPVVDYALRLRRERPDVILAGYSNLVQGYIPSRRVLAEGGYEGGESRIYYRLPTPFTPAVEENIFGAIDAVLRQTR